MARKGRGTDSWGYPAGVDWLAAGLLVVVMLLAFIGLISVMIWLVEL